MAEITTIAKMRPDGRISIPKETREAGDMKAGDFFQIKMERIDKKGM